MKNQIKTIIILVGVDLFIMAMLSILSPTFLTYGNLTAVLKRMSELGMLSIAETIVLISGGFDLSIGAIMSLSGAVVAILSKLQLNVFIIVFAALLSGVIAGVMNAALVVKLKLQPFIVTMATMSIIRSVVYALLKGNVYTDLPDAILAISDIYILKVPILFLILFFTSIFFIFYLRKTVSGRRIFAVGANEKTAFISGIFVSRVKYLVYSLSGLICAIAGLLFVARIRAVIPEAGINAPLEVITAVLIGGTTIYGGKGSVFGSLLGIFAMYLLLNGFSLLGLNPFWEVIILGIILIVVIGQEGIFSPIKSILKRFKPNLTE